ncbi:MULTISPECIES: hypothetical protein [Gracilibacillus]|uniref:hypothetical protein n=1 Tax=Gracilibacillus TaxID=74385 RepID=UPI0008245036|nr:MULTISPECIES: hypothetical protein [Gracilibacillus]
MIVLKKLGAAILSSFLFSIIWAVLYAQPEQPDYPEAWTFDEIFIIVLVVSGIIFLIGGIPSALLIDGLMKNIKFSKRIYKVMVHSLFYLLAGFLLGSLLSLLLAQEIDSFILYPSVVAALCFYLVSIGIDQVIEWSKEDQKQ